MAKKAEKEKLTLQNPNNEEMVTVLLHRDNNEHRGDLFVAVNMQEYHVPRGEPVQVPASVAHVIENMLRQENEALEYQESKGSSVM